MNVQDREPKDRGHKGVKWKTADLFGFTAEVKAELHRTEDLFSKDDLLLHNSVVRQIRRTGITGADNKSR